MGIYGLGGVGKTHLARKIVYDSEEKYDQVFWTAAVSSVEMASFYREIGESLDLERRSPDSMIRAVKNWLSNNHK